MKKKTLKERKEMLNALMELWEVAEGETEHHAIQVVTAMVKENY